MPLLTEEDLERSRRIRAERVAAGDTTFEMNRANGEPTLVAMSGVVNGWRQNTNGAALPPSQDFTQSEMQTLSGGANRDEGARPPVGDAITNDDSRRQGYGPASLDAMRQKIEESLATIDTRDALERAKKTLGDRIGAGPGAEGAELSDEKSEKPSMVIDDRQKTPPMVEVSEVVRMSPEERRAAGVSDAGYESALKIMGERRRRASEASASALRRSLSGVAPRGRRISDDEAFADSDAIIIGSADATAAPPLPF